MIERTMWVLQELDKRGTWRARAACDSRHDAEGRRLVEHSAQLTDLERHRMVRFRRCGCHRLRIMRIGRQIGSPPVVRLKGYRESQPSRIITEV